MWDGDFFEVSKSVIYDIIKLQLIMAMTVVLRCIPFPGIMIDSLNRSGECWDLKGCEGMGDCRVSSDDHVNQCYLDDFDGKGHLACAWVSTHCSKVMQVAMYGYGGE